MKKILFASTALVATAGVAAAELTIGGSARFGLAYNEAQTDETRIEQRMRVNITGIAETDAGVKLEARFRLEANEDSHANDISGRGPGAAGFAVSYGGLRVDVGNVSDVFDSGDQVDFYGYGIGLTALIEHNSVWYDTAADIGGFGAGDADATTIKARYNVGDFSASLSYTETRAQAAVAATPGSAGSAAVAANEEFQIGLGYTLANGMTIAAAYGDDDNAGDYYILNVAGSAGALGYSVILGDGDIFDAGGVSGDLAYGASINYEISSATAIQAVVSGGGLDSSETAYGLGFTHGLGGGVTLAGGIARDTSENTLADLGVKFSF
ncbi:porin [Epibacterium sp. MM17-32]|uniref:porin n=1 Tax=Epibacterium sp. MM17-32 TaxID=2917734 RepID=UPI001EF702C3|nr:porin [Epibacterium sp. MM17-32]MCG7629794.1 porin [Epibacterium sp. MM17-32]|eukprot:TRINITY_DN37644_c0_g1_i1.p2 TRINITY_DN37644_c0_g1~~TRINITY_DN37644_c0_g1_i1.p2  ORF type:complete len:341 (+),score=71.23 TRINITY_DN37644_c0_g1_i1:50-1024(+)